METHSALSVILRPRKLPKCVYELSILYQAHEIGNDASVLASQYLRYLELLSHTLSCLKGDKTEVYVWVTL